MAQPSATDRDDPRARQFFEVGQQAYEKSQYLLAIEAFEQAYAIVQRPGLLFSLGQAHQRQFRLEADESQLHAAVDAYRRYLAAAPDGRRRGEALAAIESLSSIDRQLHPQGADSPAAAIFGKLLISSPTPGVVVTVAGDRVEVLPAALELPSQTYDVVATAPGYEPLHRKLQISAATAVPLNLELRALPARLSIYGAAGAEAFIDGQPVGYLPAPSLTLAAGSHSVAVRKAGRRTRSVRVALARGESAAVDLELEPTVQRSAAWVVGVGGIAALACSGVFAGLALDRDHAANHWDALRVDGQISSAQANELNAAVDARDRFKTVAVVSGIASAALLGAAVVLYLADSPAPPSRTDRLSGRKQRVEIDASVGPGGYGAWLGARF